MTLAVEPALETPSDRTTPLVEAYRGWTDLAPLKHLGAIAALAAAATLRWWPHVTDGALHIDEQYYFEAFRRVLAGDSPYGSGYFYYPPAFAYGGAWLLSTLGGDALLALLRGANLMALGAVVWFSFAWTRPGYRLPLALGVTCLSPGANLGVCSGNVSFLIVALLFVAMFLWHRRPLVSGVALASGIALKPIMPVAAVVLGGHRPTEPGRRHLVASSLGGALAALLLLAFPYLREMLVLASGPTQNLRTVSLHRILRDFGLDVGASTVMIGVAILAFAFVRWRPLGRTHLLCVTISAVTLSAPMMWNHTLLVALPVQVLAVTLAWRCWRSARRRWLGVRRRSYELIFVVLGLAAIQLCDGVGGAAWSPPWARIVAAAVPCLAPTALAAFIIARTEPF